MVHSSSISRDQIPHNLSQVGRLASEYSFPINESVQFLTKRGGALYEWFGYGTDWDALHLDASASTRMIVTMRMRM